MKPKKRNERGEAKKAVKTRCRSRWEKRKTCGLSRPFAFYTLSFALRFSCLFLFIISLTACKPANDHPRTVRLWDDNWLFHYGDIPDGGTAPSINASQWQKLDLPHDWSIEMPFLKSDGGIAVGQTQGGTAWYRKTFTIAPDEKDKIHSLYFEGIYMEAEIWINGIPIASHPYGYTSFSCELTPHCKPPGQENTLAVKVKNEGKNSRWYSGSGIYRHVWFISTSPLHLNQWNTYIVTEKQSENKADIYLAFDIFNESRSDETIQTSVSIRNRQNQKVTEANGSRKVKAGSVETDTFRIMIPKPQLWSIDHPCLYTVEIKIQANGNIQDQLIIPLGIRTLSFTPEEGFCLNGKPVKLKGGCVHHDNGLLGAAAIDRAEEKKAELLKANGFNAVRCAHNPPSEKFLETCDRLGLLVIDEAFDQWQKPKNPDDYHRFFDRRHDNDLTSMVLRDRNHPSVIMWSIGNEIQERSDSSGIAIAKRLKKIIRTHDPSRPVTAAINDYWDNPHLKWKNSFAAFEPLDVCGYNYMWWEYENDCKAYPERIIYGSETTARERAICWDLVEKYPQIIGDFVWTAIDYLGESGIAHAIPVADGENEPPQFMDYPWFNAWCGDIDICGYKKPQTALRDVLWNESPIEILVHVPIADGKTEKISYWGWQDTEKTWNWAGNEGKTLDVTVYTRYPSVKLYLNGKLIGEQETATGRPDKYTARFKVKYESGELKATAAISGEDKVSASLVTTGPPVKIRLKTDRTELKNTKNELAYVQIEMVDKDGNITPDKDLQLELSLSGNGKIAAAGNACPTDMDSFRSLSPKTYKGRAIAILQPAGKKGTMTLNVKAQGYDTQTLSINIK